MSVFDVENFETYQFMCFRLLVFKPAKLMRFEINQNTTMFWEVLCKF